MTVIKKKYDRDNWPVKNIGMILKPDNSSNQQSYSSLTRMNYNNDQKDKIFWKTQCWHLHPRGNQQLPN